MTASMTAFSRQSTSEWWGTLTIELRSVNQRYLEPHFRLPETLHELEPEFRETLRDTLSRGKVECTVRYLPGEESDEMVLDQQKLSELKAIMHSIRGQIPDADMPNALELAAYPGVMKVVPPDIEQIKQAARQLFKKTVADLQKGREREGKRLAELILERLDGVSEQVKNVRSHLPNLLERQRTQLLEKLEAAKAELDPQRLEAEMVIVAQKADVAEELDRLETHVNEVKHQLKQKGPIGRRLDFLMQELNREANTLSSKAIVSETTHCAVELKVLIEQMREQIQNVE